MFCLDRTRTEQPTTIPTTEPERAQSFDSPPRRTTGGGGSAWTVGTTPSGPSEMSDLCLDFPSRPHKA